MGKGNKKRFAKERRRFMAELRRDRAIFTYPPAGPRMDMPNGRRLWRRFLLIEVGVVAGLVTAVGIYKLLT